jgi:hypothetical protein
VADADEIGQVGQAKPSLELIVGFGRGPTFGNVERLVIHLDDLNELSLALLNVLAKQSETAVSVNAKFCSLVAHWLSPLAGVFFGSLALLVPTEFAVVGGTQTCRPSAIMRGVIPPFR